MTSVFSETDLKKEKNLNTVGKDFWKLCLLVEVIFISLDICFGYRLKDEDVKEEKPGLYLL